MKNIVFLIFIAIATTTATAQKSEWQTDLATAQKIAAKENKSIILVFQGSDWCAPCIKLDKEIWQDAAFKDLAKDKFVMLQADFPRKRANALSKEQAAANAKLAETYNKNGVFPFAVVLDSKGKKLGEAGYQKIAPKDYFKILYNFTK
ncbi:MAG: thioredoxin family protein [Nonlabens sp.]|nr:thioredoxin family protein [Nonlabens sp.]